MKKQLFNTATVVAVALLGLTALVAAKPANAQAVINPILPVKGTQEISLNGNFQFDPTNGIALNVGYGYFFNRNLEVSGILDYTNPDVGDSTYGLTAAVDYHFPTASALLPFAGVFVGYNDDGGSSDTYTSYGVRGGVKYFLNQNVSANAFLLYGATDQDNSDSQFSLRLGISAYLR